MSPVVLLINGDAFELATLAEAMRLRGISVNGKSHAVATAENLFKTLRPDVVVIDLAFHGRSGIELAHEFRKSDKSVGIVHTTSCPDLRLIGIAEKQLVPGARIVLKRSMADFDLLCEAIAESRNAAETDESAIWVNQHAATHSSSPFAIINQLTDIQVETLRLLASGMSNGEIAKMRFVSEKSVEQIVARIAQHLAIESDRKRNLRVLLTNHFHNWVGAADV